MPTYRFGRRRLFVGTWKHGISLYGWRAGGEPAFVARHPELRTSTGTIRLPPGDAAGVLDEELRELVRAALGD